ncbi:MAG: O-antigen ligase domain-containing protein [Myxococcales bacterium]|nr:O-antigen ligase domain-containing protein [Myxococcales bacterium]
MQIALSFLVAFVVAAGCFVSGNEVWVPIGIAGSFAAYCTAKLPVIAVCLLAVAPNFQYSQWVSPVKIIGALVLPILFVRSFVRPVPIHGKPWFIYGFVTFQLWQLLCDALGEWQPDLNYLTTAFGIVAVLIVLRSTMTTFKALEVMILVQSASLAVIGLTMPFFLTAADMATEVVRTGGLTGEPNSLGGVVGRTIGFSMAAMLYSGYAPITRLLAGLSVSAGIWVTYAANSRSGTLSLLVAVTTLTLLLPRTQPKRLVGLGFLALAIAAALIAAPQSYTDRTVSSLQSSIGLSDRATDFAELTSGRSTLNVIALEAFEQSPFFGHGTRGFSRFSSRAGFPNTGVHNTYLSIAVTAGLFAFLGVVALHFAAVFTAFRALSKSGKYRPLVAACAAAGMAAIADCVNSAVVLTQQNWTVLGVCALIPAMVHSMQQSSATGADQQPVARDLLTSPTSRTGQLAPLRPPAFASPGPSAAPLANAAKA